MLYKLLLLFPGLLAFGAIPIYAQPPCATNPIAGDYCSTATPICNLNGYCGNTSSFYTNTVSPTNNSNETNTPLGNVFCASIQNNSWLKFIANANTAVFSVWCSNCANGNGIQMQIYSTPDCYNFTAVSNCWNPLSPTNGQITATGLTPGTAYYFMIDGTNGDVCDYVIACDTGINQSPAVTPSQFTCSGAPATLTATGGILYAWTANPPDPSLTGQQTNATINVTPAVNTVYTVTIINPGLNTFCISDTTILTTSVSLSNLAVQVQSVTPSLCNQGTGTATVMAGGGIQPYTFLWNTSPAQTNAMLQNVPAGSYTVTVTDSAGCAASTEVIVVTVAGPVVTSPALPPVCLNLPSFSLSGGIPAGGTYSGPGVNGLQFDPMLAGVGLIPITYTYTDPNGCIGADTQDITVLPLPVVTFSNPLTPQCIYNTVYPLSGGTPAGGTYSGTGVYGTNFNASLAGIGNHTLTYTFSDPLTGCTNFQSRIIAVHDIPAVTFTPPGIICGNMPAFSISGGQPSGGSYSGSSIVNGVFDPATGPGSYPVTYTYTDPYGCVNSVVQSFVVSPVVPVSVSIEADKDTICLGTEVTYTAWPVNGGLFPVCQWMVNGTPVGSGSLIFVYAPTEGDTVSCILTSGEACPVNNPATSNPVRVEVLSFNLPSLSLEASATTVCRGDQVTFLATPLDAGFNPEMIWRINGFIIQSGQSPNFSTLVQSTPCVVSCTLISTNTCTGGQQVIESIPVLISSPEPGINFQASVVEICLDDHVNLSAGTGFVKYLWQDGSTTSSILAGQPGTYFVEVTDSIGCKAVDSVQVIPCALPLYLPNCFTPNSDHINNTFQAFCASPYLSEFNMKIFNRWGELIFESNDIEQGWDGKYQGKPCPVDVYVVVVVYAMEYLDYYLIRDTKRGPVYLLK